MKFSRERSIIEGYWTNLPKRPERGLWVQAGIHSANQLWPSKGIGLIDAFLLCFVRTSHFQLWTLDKNWPALPNLLNYFICPMPDDPAGRSIAYPYGVIEEDVSPTRPYGMPGKMAGRAPYANILKD